MTRNSKTRAGIRVFAEFTAIVVGVLVAFAVDDWDKARADRRVELEYLEALAADLRGDSAILEGYHIPNLARRQAAAEAIWPVARGRATVPVDTIAFLQEVAASHRVPLLTVTGRTYEELLATGSLRLVESPELRSSIVAYYQFRNLAVERSRSRESGYSDLVRAYLPDMLEQTDSEAAAARIRMFGVRDAVEAVRTDEFVRALRQRFNYLAAMRPTLDSLLEQVQELIPQVDHEIARLE